MNWLNNLKITRKLFLAFGILILMMVTLTVYSSFQLIKIDKAYGNLAESTSRRHGHLSDALGVLALLRLNNVSTAYQINEDEIAQLYTFLHHHDYKAMCDEFLDHLHKYKANVSGDISLGGKVLNVRLESIRRAEELFITRFEPLFEQIQQGVRLNDKALVRRALGESYYSSTEITDELDSLRERTVRYIEAESDRITSYAKRTAISQFIVALIIIITSIYISLYMSKKIKAPIQELENAVMEIATGNLNTPIRSDSKDELGILSNYIGDMVDSLKNATQAKSSFLANMSHEMRTPLNVVVGLTTLQMENTELKEEVHEDLRKINSAAELLLGLVNDVLDISKIEAGKLELVPVEYNSASLLNDVITLNKIRIQRKPINFKIDIDENVPYNLLGDELRVKQIFNNLLSNAFKYTMEGYVTLYVTTLVDGQNKNDIWLSVTVSDTGIGIKPGDIEKLFSDYKQLDTKNNRKIEGTGLGLAITKELVEKMDGKISVQSEYGKGSSFHVIIRQNRVNEKTLGVEIVKNLCAFHYMDEKQRASAALVRPDLSYARVLVVDDFPTNLDVAAGMLRKYKMQVDCVSSGREAVDIVRSGEPVYDTIFMDHMMPEMDGVTATRLIRGMDSQYAKTVPIISLTANALAESEQMFLENGFNAFLSKPINILRLDAVVKRWIQKKDGSAESETAEAHEEVDGSDIKIPGLNALIGLDLCGGEMDTFRFALGSFISHTPNSIEKLRNVSRENLHNYAIAVHGLKGVCAAIGAEDARAKAYRLETAAKAGDLDTVLAENDALLQDAQTLVRDITDWLAKTEKVGWIFHQKA